MRTPSFRAERGSTLVVVLLFGAAGLVILGGTLGWVTSNTTMSQRNNEYFRTVAVAEAATEKVISQIAFDYQQNGEVGILANLANYRATVPTAAEDALFANYAFHDAQGTADATYVRNVPPNDFRVLTAQYRGLRGYGTAFHIVSDARELTSRFNITAAVRQDIEMATIPLFQFAIFYNLDLEINPGPNMTVTGPVHSNYEIFLEPQATLTFQGDVTAAGNILNHKKPGDPLGRTRGSVVYAPGVQHDAGVSTLNLPIGTNNSPAVVREVVEPPPLSELPSSPLGKERFYNKADMIVTVTDLGVSVTSGIVNNRGTTIGAAHYNKFVSTAANFYNKRELKTVNAVQIDVAGLREWNRTNTLLRPVLSLGDVRIVYVDDRRSQSSSTQPGVRVVNGETLLPKGLTIATPDPLYVLGHYNCPPAARGTANTSGTLPAALIADAITILSGAWNDAASTKALSSRVAVDTTVNAAFLAGIVQTANSSYSGGVENFPRFLEDWAGRTFTYNGSMVVMFDSRLAVGDWRGTGAGIGIYNPPVRKWAFDLNFRDVTKIPPGTPCVRALIRGSWAMIRPNSIDVVDMY